jgi:hypothetical protein
LAKRKPNRAPLIAAFLALSALVLAGLGWWITGDVARQRAEDKAAAAIVPVLPVGRMRVVHTSATEVRYLAIDELKPAASGRVAAKVLRVGRSPNVFDDRASMIVRYETIDCAGGAIFEGRIGEFDPAGRLFVVTNGYAGKRGRRAGSEDGEVAVACGQAAEPGRVVANARTAQRETQSLPDAYEAFAEAHPKDADAWAWLCAAGARGRWRDKTPADCNHAVALRPDDLGTRLDRGYLFLMLGRRPAADADFRKVAAQDPNNATAIFGHALVLAMNGDEGASKKDRARALAMDPDIPAWLERTYRFLISPQYRKA